MEIMDCLDNWDDIFPDFIYDGWGNLKVYIIQMNDVRVEILNDIPDFVSCLNRIDDLEGI